MMKWWWQKHQKQAVRRLTVQSAWRALPKGAQSQIISFEEEQSAEHYWWLRQEGQYRDLALMAVPLGDRDEFLTVTADEVARFSQEAATRGAVPMGLVAVEGWEVDPGIMAYLTRGIKQHGHQVFVVVPTGVLYDFLANATVNATTSAPTAGELLDGWPMRQAATLAAYVLDDNVGPRLRAVPLPGEALAY